MQTMQDNEKFCFPDMKNEGANPSKGRDADRIIINVGGHKHETHLSTLKNFPDTRLAWIAESPLAKQRHSLEDGGPMEYFFDRHPGVFVHVLNYYRTGKLHCPSDVCGPVFEEELNFWGIDELQMEPCCWSTYTRHRDAIAFEKVFTVNQQHQEDDQSDVGDPSCIGSTQNRRYWCNSMKQKIWDSLEKPYSSKGAQILALFSLIVIITSVVTFCLETMPQLRQYKKTFQTLDHSYCAVFTVDFIVRVFSCPNIGAFFRSTLNWCDIMSVIPFYTNMMWSVDYLNVVLVVRLFRIFRLFRFFRFMSGLQVIGHTLKASARELTLLVLILLIPMVIFSSLLFYTEQAFDGDPRFYSIPHTFWWAVITMTTVGYGDIVPQTAVGRVIGIMCACFGVLIVALPVSVIGSNFSLFYSHAQAQLKLPSKRKQPILVGAASALMSAVDHEISSTGSGSYGGESHDGSESNNDEASKRLLANENENEKDVQVEIESIELQSKSVPEKPSYLGCTTNYSSLHSLENKKNAEPFRAPAMNLGKGLKAMGDIMLNIGAPPQRRMAIAGVSTGHSPALRRSNSGRRRTRSKSGESLRKRTNTNSSEKGDDSNISCNEHNDEGTPEPCVGMVDNKDDSGFTKPKLPREDGNRLECERNLCDRHSDEQEEQDVSNKLSYLSSPDNDAGTPSEDDVTVRTFSLTNKQSNGKQDEDGVYNKKRRPGLRDIKVCVVETEDSDSSGPTGDYSPPYKNMHTESSRPVFPRYGKRRSATINICNA